MKACTAKAVRVVTVTIITVADVYVVVATVRSSSRNHSTGSGTAFVSALVPCVCAGRATGCNPTTQALHDQVFVTHLYARTYLRKLYCIGHSRSCEGTILNRSNLR